MKTIVCCVATTFSVLAALGTSTPNPGKNLVNNGDFSQGTAGWTIEPTHHPERISVSEESCDKSRNSLKTDGSFDEGEPLFIMLTQSLTNTIKPATTYRLKADIKRTSRGRIEVSVLERETDKSDWKINPCGHIPTGKFNVWEHFEYQFTTADKIEAAVLVIYNLQTGGGAWFDNIELTEVTGE